MEQYAQKFLDTLNWYRKISFKLIDEIPAEYMHQQISSRSLQPACQLVDLGDFHLRVAHLIDPNADQVERPNPDTATPQEIKDYISKTQKVLETVLMVIEDKENFTITWFDRMTFNFPDVLSFVLAHEAMHHGELMSFIYDKDLIS